MFCPKCGNMTLDKASSSGGGGEGMHAAGAGPWRAYACMRIAPARVHGAAVACSWCGQRLQPPVLGCILRRSHCTAPQHVRLVDVAMHAAGEVGATPMPRVYAFSSLRGKHSAFCSSSYSASCLPHAHPLHVHACMCLICAAAHACMHACGWLQVEVNVGPDGAELFGVRRKHVLKGTVYSLPKPRVRAHEHEPHGLHAHAHAAMGTWARDPGWIRSHRGTRTSKRNCCRSSAQPGCAVLGCAVLWRGAVLCRAGAARATPSSPRTCS